MNDQQILRLYFDRSEDAIAQTAAKYGAFCYTVAYQILRNAEDSEECVNDTYLKAWSVIPPHRPQKLAAFLGKITRNLSIDLYRRYTAEKRGGSEMALALDELEMCVPSRDSGWDHADRMALTDALNGFLETLPSQQRQIFMRRYWYVNSIKEIAQAYGLTESKVKMSLLRSRGQLKAMLEKEGVIL